MTVIINGTTGINSVNGSAAAPSVTGTDTDTGIVYGTNTVSIATGGTERLQVDSSGNVGVGVTPSAWTSAAGKSLQIYSAANSIWANGIGGLTTSVNATYDGGWKYTNTSGSAARFDCGNGNGTFSWALASGTGKTAGDALSWSTVMTLDASGNLGVGTTSIQNYTNSKTLAVGGAAAGVLDFVASNIGSGNNRAAQIYGDSSGNLVFSTGASNTLAEHARIDSSGVFSVQNASTSGGIQIIRSDMNSQSTSGQTSLYLGDNGSGIKAITREKAAANTAYTRIYSEYGYGTHALGASFFNTVAYQGNNSTTWSTTSDERVKTNIRPISNALEKICALNAVHFEYKNAIGKTKTSFIAQEFEQVFPGHVHEVPAPDDLKEFVGEDGMMKALDPELIPYLVAAIQEQQSIIEQLKARLDAANL